MARDDASNERSALLPRDSDGDERRWGVTRALTASCGRVGHRTRGTLASLAMCLLAASFIIGAVTLFLHQQVKAGGHGAQTSTLVMDEEFDAIIIGGGPAGAVMAKSLSDDSWRRVLLIEAGNSSQAQIGGSNAIPSALNANGLTPFDVPFYWTNVANTPSVHWGYPDVNIAKALGGCGIHNAMLYVRALPSDMQRWGMENWTWDKAREIYMGIEDYDGPNSSYHSTQGFVRTSPPAVIDSVSKQFIEACEEVGIPRTLDFNAPYGRYGAGYYDFNTRDGVRESAAKSFLGPILKTNSSTSGRKNFRLLLDTTVTRINIDDTNVAKGVEVRYNNGTRQLIRLTENGKVVLTAGAINTPKILMLSGIGHNDMLRKVGLPVKKHLGQVGMNLQDHPVLGVIYENVAAVDVDLRSELNAYFNATRAGKTSASDFGLMGSAGISAGAFLMPPGATEPEIQLTLFPRKSEPHMSNSSKLNHATEVLFTVALLSPRARNRVVLVRSKHPDGGDDDADDHLIPRVVSEVPETEAEHLRESDVWKLSWAIAVVREIAAVLAKKGVIGDEIAPGPSVLTPHQLDRWVLDNVFRNSHWVGSASMGNTVDEGVVDSHLRVYGVENLRVADASVIPLIPNGNVHSSVVMVASHGAEILRKDEREERRQTEK